MRYTDDPVRDYDAFCRAREKEMEALPVCDECGSRIEDVFCYQIGSEIICENCMENCKVYTEDVISKC